MLRYTPDQKEGLARENIRRLSRRAALRACLHEHVSGVPPHTFVEIKIRNTYGTTVVQV